jgi:hypothetical protein
VHEGFTDRAWLVQKVVQVHADGRARSLGAAVAIEQGNPAISEGADQVTGYRGSTAQNPAQRRKVGIAALRRDE